MVTLSWSVEDGKGEAEKITTTRDDHGGNAYKRIQKNVCHPGSDEKI